MLSNQEKPFDIVQNARITPVAPALNADRSEILQEHSNCCEAQIPACCCCLSLVAGNAALAGCPRGACKHHKRLPSMPPAKRPSLDKVVTAGLSEQVHRKTFVTLRPTSDVRSVRVQVQSERLQRAKNERRMKA